MASSRSALRKAVARLRKPIAQAAPRPGKSPKLANVSPGARIGPGMSPIIASPVRAGTFFHPQTLYHRLALASPVVLALACADAEPGPVASLSKVSLSSVAVGEPLAIEGEDFIDAEQGWVDVSFHGRFWPEGSSNSQDARFSVALQRGEDGSLVWPRFGAYRVPFGKGDEVGLFTGSVTAQNRFYDPEEPAVAESYGLPVSLEVEPSIVLKEARASGDGWTSDCKDPISTAVNLVSYVFRFEAVGFDAEEFELTLGAGLIIDGVATTGVTRISKPASDNQHAVLVQFAEVPENVDGFTTSISVAATDEDGQSRRLEVPIVVRRPLQAFFPTPMALAELYEPEPVSGCIPGGSTSVQSKYSESRSETRTRSITSTEAEGWTSTVGSQFSETRGVTDTDSTSTSEGTMRTLTNGTSSSFSDITQVSDSETTSRSTSAELGFSQTDTDTYSWGVHDEKSNSMSKEAGLEVGFEAGLPIGGKVNGKASGKLGWVDGTSSGTSEGGSSAAASSFSGGLSTTESNARTLGRARSTGWTWGVSQTYAEANSYTTTRQVSQARSFTEAETRSESVARLLMTSEALTESVSTTEATSLDASATIPENKNGVWYRQASRLVRKGVVVAYDLCGNAAAVGEVLLDDWTWAPNLAVGDTCPPAPDLPAAECLIGPCGSP